MQILKQLLLHNQDLAVALQRSGDPGNLQRLKGDFVRLSNLSSDSAAKDADWDLLISSLDSAAKVIDVSNHVCS